MYPYQSTSQLHLRPIFRHCKPGNGCRPALMKAQNLQGTRLFSVFFRNCFGVDQTPHPSVLYMYPLFPAKAIAVGHQNSPFVFIAAVWQQSHTESNSHDTNSSLSSKMARPQGHHPAMYVSYAMAFGVSPIQPRCK